MPHAWERNKPNGSLGRNGAIHLSCGGNLGSRVRSSGVRDHAAPDQVHGGSAAGILSRDHPAAPRTGQVHPATIFAQGALQIARSDPRTLGSRSSRRLRVEHPAEKLVNHVSEQCIRSNFQQSHTTSTTTRTCTFYAVGTMWVSLQNRPLIAVHGLLHLRSMRDPRLQKLADVLVNYSVAVKKGQLVRISASPNSVPLVLEIYRKVLE